MKDNPKKRDTQKVPDVNPRPHEFPEYEDMPTDRHDESSPGKPKTTPDSGTQYDTHVDPESATDITNE